MSDILIHILYLSIFLGCFNLKWYTGTSDVDNLGEMGHRTPSPTWQDCSTFHVVRKTS